MPAGLGFMVQAILGIRSDHVWVNISDFLDDRFILKKTLPAFTWCHSFFIKMIFNLPAKQVKNTHNPICPLR